jgi:hypothetical protein
MQAMVVAVTQRESSQASILQKQRADRATEARARVTRL